MNNQRPFSLSAHFQRSQSTRALGGSLIRVTRNQTSSPTRPTAAIRMISDFIFIIRTFQVHSCDAVTRRYHANNKSFVFGFGEPLMWI
jgi:hypothetical protein